MSDEGRNNKGEQDGDAFAATMAPTTKPTKPTKPTTKALAQPTELSSARTVATPPGDTRPIAESNTIAAPTTGGQSINLPATPLENRRFQDRYATRSILGEGGMGRIQLCRDDVVGRHVAMKTIHSHHSDNADTMSRFLREARVQGQLEHPSVVPVYDMGVDEHGAPFFTMKRLKGMTLRTILHKLRNGDTDVAATFHFHKLLNEFNNVCQAVEFAHARGVVHRDLKPDNIMLGDFGEVYVLDWGIAKIAGVDDELVDPATSARIDTGQITTDRTAFGSVLGTPGYMSPEQTRGEVDEVDQRADIYALGAILFEILTLQPLHIGKTAQALLASTTNGANANAAARYPQRNIPPELEAVCIRATATAADDRFENVRDLYLAVEAYLAGDRDLEQRKQLAANYATQATAAAKRILELGDDSANIRREAMRQASRAIALDPTSETAAHVITQLMITPPKIMPAEVERSSRAAVDARATLHMRGATAVYVAMVAFMPLYFWMGITDWYVATGLSTSVVVCGLIAGYAAIKQRLTRPQMTVAITMNLVFLVIMSRAFGWFVLVPGLATASTIAFLLHPYLQSNKFTIACGCAAIIVPFTLELLGVFGSSYVFIDGKLVISSHLFVLKRVPVLITFVLSGTALVVASALLVINNRNHFVEAERQLHLQTWQLRQLMPQQSNED